MGKGGQNLDTVATSARVAGAKRVSQVLREGRIPMSSVLIKRALVEMGRCVRIFQDPAMEIVDCLARWSRK